MCLCFPHCDSTHCELHCYRQLSPALNTGASLCTSGRWYASHSGRPVAASLKNRWKEEKKRKEKAEIKKENKDMERKKWHHSGSDMRGCSVCVVAGVCLVCLVVLSLHWYDTLNEDFEHTHTLTHTPLHKIGLCLQWEQAHSVSAAKTNIWEITDYMFTKGIKDHHCCWAGKLRWHIEATAERKERSPFLRLFSEIF